MQFYGFAGRKVKFSFRLLSNSNNSALVDGHGVVFENGLGRLDGNDPFGFDEQIDGFGHRRFALRWVEWLIRFTHTKRDAALAYFGTDGGGWVMPLPIVGVRTPQVGHVRIARSSK